MRFVITGEWRRNRLLQTIIVLFLVYVILLWMTNALLYFSRMGLTYESVVQYYLGSEQRYLGPRSYAVLLEISHFHLFAMGILLLTLTHLMLFVPLDSRVKAWLIIVPFVAGIADEGAGWLIRYVSPLFAYFKIASFLTLQASLAALIAVSMWSVFAAPPEPFIDDGGEADVLTDNTTTSQ
ncbi:MAG: hypothetical protein ACREQB_00630 [Candidatus Binataceae bacterium]